MAKVRFRGKEFKVNSKEYLIPAVYEYARNSDDELYEIIMSHKVSLYLNDEIVKVDDWCITEVSGEDEILITPLIAGGDLGGFLQVVLGAVLLTAAILVPGPLSAHLWVQGMAMIGVSMMLGGLSSMLFQPTLPQMSGSGTSSSQTYSWSGIKTTAQVDSPIPIVYGTHMVGGNVIGIYTESHGDANYLNMLIALCEGEIEGICKKNDVTAVYETTYNVDDPYILLDDQFIDLYHNVTWWYRSGTNTVSSSVTTWSDSTTYVKEDVVTNNNYKYICITGHINKEPGIDSGWEDYWTLFNHYPFNQNVIPYFNNSIVQYDDGREIVYSDYTQYTTTKEVDRVLLQLKSPALYEANKDSGNINPYTITYEVEYKKTGDVDWKALHVKKWAFDIEGLEKSDGSISNINNIEVSFYKQVEVVGTQPPNITIEIINNTFEDFERCNTEREKSYRIEYIIYDTNSNILERSYIKQTMSRTTRIVGGNPREGIEGTRYCSSPRHEYTKFYFHQYEIELKHNVSIGDKFSITSREKTEEDASEESNNSLLWNTFNLIPGTSVTDSYSTKIEMTGKSKTEVWTSLDLDFVSLGLDKDTYDIRIKRTDAGPSDSFYISDQLLLNSVTEIVNGKFIYPNTALLGLRIRATEQLSGAPPNINVLVRGKKVIVPDIEDTSPSGTDYAFHDCYWNESSDQWETYNATQLYWNNTDSWRIEYSDNSMLCVADYMLNTRYGIGKYITDADLYIPGIIDAIKECHKIYDPYDHFSGSTDALNWWDESTDDNWNNFLSIVSNTDNVTITNTPSTRNVAVSYTYDQDSPGHSRSGTAELLLDVSYILEEKQNYILKVTIANISGVIDDFVTFYNDIEIDGSNNISTNGVKEFAFITTGSVRSIKLHMYFRHASCSFDITDISLDHSVVNPVKMHYHTYNGVMDSAQSANMALFEMCDSFRCWPVWYGGKFNFVINKDETPVHSLTMGNLSEFSQSFTPLSEIPNRIIGQFTDKDIKYNMRALMTKSSFSDLNELNEITVGLKGITNIKTAEREIKFKLGQVTNCTHNISAKCKLDYIHGTAGDIIKLQNDLPSWGQGGRVLDYTSTNITIDKEYEFSNVATDTFTISYQKDNNSFVDASINTASINNDDSLMVIPINSLNGSPCTDAVYYIGVTDNSYKTFRLTSVSRSDVDNVQITGIEHIPSLYSNEATISVIQDDYIEPPNPMKIPESPYDCSVQITEPVSGIGFIFKASPPNDGTNIKEIVIQMSDETGDYHVVALIPSGQTESTYIDNNLEVDKTYTFRFFCRTEYKSGVSNSVIISKFLSIENYIPEPPTGVYIKGYDPNNVDSSSRHKYEDKDLNIAWNPVGITSTNSITITGYYLEIYHDSITADNLLRTTTVNSEEYTYFFDNNVEDGDGTPYSNIIFVIYSINVSQIKSSNYTIFNTINTSPDTPVNVTANSIVGGVQFAWGKNTERDLKKYQYTTKVGSGSYTAYADITDNTYTRTLTATEIGNYGNSSNIALKVKAVDFYNQESAESNAVEASANTVADNIFQISGSMSGSFGTVASLYDGNLTATAITIP